MVIVEDLEVVKDCVRNFSLVFHCVRVSALVRMLGENVSIIALPRPSSTMLDVGH
jgi:hypothetical protein